MNRPRLLYVISQDSGNFKIADGDTHHPNVAGHAMIAERLHRALREFNRNAVR
jgi:lysophospholipase L1-like esterase